MKMNIVIFDNEDKKAYGYVGALENIEEFEKEVQEELGYKVKFSDVKVEKCIMTRGKIPAEIVIPIDKVGATICNCYTADIEKIEEEE
jgi:hypothetical protein